MRKRKVRLNEKESVSTFIVCIHSDQHDRMRQQRWISWGNGSSREYRKYRRGAGSSACTIWSEGIGLCDIVWLQCNSGYDFRRLWCHRSGCAWLCGKDFYTGRTFLYGWSGQDNSGRGRHCKRRLCRKIRRWGVQRWNSRGSEYWCVQQFFHKRFRLHWWIYRRTDRCISRRCDRF